MRVKRDSAALKFSSSSDIDEASPFKNNEEEAERDAMLGSRTSVEGDVKGLEMTWESGGCIKSRSYRRV